LILFLPLILLFLANDIQGSDPLKGLLEGIRKRYAQLPGLVIPYSREVVSRSMAMLGEAVKGDLATGKIYFMPPHHLRLEQETPEAETIIGDGQTLWWYIPEKKQAYKYTSRRFGRELKVLGDILQGLKNVRETFKVTLEGHTGEGDSLIKLIPDPSWESVDHITLTVTEDHQIKVVTIHNVVGGLTRFRLQDLTIRQGFEEGFFTFEPPDGVKVITENH